MAKYSKSLSRLLKESGLKDADAKSLRLRELSSAQLKALFPRRADLHGVTGHEIPYFDLAGEPVGYCRYRLHDVDEPIPKYLQKSG